ncbi:acyl-CoA/acyl-ACP dehydrogenase [Sphaerisporangium sp. TRM90804]|uniref:acyl-CoA dehydrogenase family protein n=1 Tax=Sphaerisporangium sp. TRM90804 TaxID=3031113 RepID=UPI00244CB85F|nr:acyl-CoA/acyl-ACP dehydrogenase [Sphaerisporangium sp. TRM90804]MDH2429090.1 acyl-CoA/acyl-ACP dehydrogenase [Sphaerisporangium sp. TRM90804]
MDFAYTEDQRELTRLARRILTDRVTHESLTAMEARGGERFDRGLWSTLADAGLLGVSLPAEHGGGGYGPLEQCLVLEEAGRALAPVPLHATAVLGAWPIAAFGTEEQRATWVAPAARGERVLTAALAGPVGAPEVTARRTGDGWRLSGVRTGVPAATVADLIVVPAGGRLFLVPAGTAGLTITPQRTTAKDVTGLVRLDVTLPDDAVLGDPGEERAGVVESARDMATLGLCALQLGVASRALEAAAEYAGRRRQFNRPIGSFQAVGHRLADCHIDVEAIRLTMWQAAWLLSPQAGAGARERAEAVATAKFWAADGGHRVAHAVVHVHGGMGVAEEYFVHRYFLHAKQIEFALGGATEQALRLGALLATSADHPRGRPGGDLPTAVTGV